MKIIIDNKIPFIEGSLEPYADVVYCPASAITAAVVRDADCLIVRTRTACNHELLHGSAVKFIASATIGTDHINGEWCSKHGVAWAAAAGCNASAVLQYTATALLAYAQRHSMLLQGKTIGIIGLGNVGSRVAMFAKALGMRIMCCDPPLHAAGRMDAGASLYEIAECCDVITFHTPLTCTGKHATYHLANADFFSYLRRCPLLINTSRGEVVDEVALCHALRTGAARDAILDVWENEPCISHETLSLAAIGTSHIAGYSANGKRMAAQMAVRAVGRFFHLPAAEWSPPSLPASALPVIDADMPMQHRIFALCSHYYDIWADDAALRGQPHASEQLRSAYILRSEPPLQDYF
jgi:erythronate-4-phosphate dehydrogenase